MTIDDLGLESLHATANELFRDALDDCSIESAFDRRIRFEGTKMYRLLAESERTATFDLENYKRIFVVAIGKAAPAMLKTLLSRMNRRQGLRGVCCSNQIPHERHWRIRYFEGGHPLPNEGSFAAARAALALLRKARRDTLVLFLISGGASALFDLPLDPAISLEDTMVFHQALIASGAPITEVNVIRKHFSAVKGGRLAISAPDSIKISILLPDVPLRSLDTLASGPTLPNRSTADEVHRILERYDLLKSFPESVRSFFLREEVQAAEAGKSRRAPFLPRIPWIDGNSKLARSTTHTDVPVEEYAFRNSIFEVLLSSSDLVESARARASRLGFHAVIDNACDDWDYADAANYLLKRFHDLRAEHPRCCLISGGEVTVTLDRSPGAGGRNQQFVLACALELQQYRADTILVFSAGSDGIDGNTRAAGAIADPSTVSRAIQFGYSPEEALAAFNACPLFTSLGDSVVTGPTGHNLRDLRLLISDAKKP
jgi:hydroxypyruvate reductase